MKLPLRDTMKQQIDSRTASVRFAIVTGLIVLLMGPLALVSCVVTDRHEFRTKAIRDIGKSWGGMQRLAGPMIVIPFVTTHDDSEHVQQVAIMPKSLEIDVASRHEMRKRAIYRMPVFNFDVTASGVFMTSTWPHRVSSGAISPMNAGSHRTVFAHPGPPTISPAGFPACYPGS